MSWSILSHHLKFSTWKRIYQEYFDVPPNSLKDPNVGSKAKKQKKKLVWAHLLTYNTLGVGRHADVLGWD